MRAGPGRPSPLPAEDRGGAGHVRADGQRLAAHPLGDADGAGRGEGRAQGLLRPAAQVRGEDAVVARAGRGHRTRGERGDHRVVHAQRHPGDAQLLAQQLLTAVGVRGHARRHVHFGGPARGGHRAHLRHDRPRADHEPPAALSQRGVEVVEAVGEEGPPVGRVEAGRVDPRVPHEQRHHLVRRPQSRAQRGWSRRRRSAVKRTTETVTGHSGGRAAGGVRCRTARVATRGRGKRRRWVRCG